LASSFKSLSTSPPRLLASAAGLGTAWYMMEDGLAPVDALLRALDHLDCRRTPDADPYAGTPSERAAALAFHAGAASAPSPTPRRAAARGPAKRHRDGHLRRCLVDARRIRTARSAPPDPRSATPSQRRVMREPDGRAIVTRGRRWRAMPARQLAAPGSASRINLVLTVQDPAYAAAVPRGRRSAAARHPTQRVPVDPWPKLPKWLTEVGWRTVIGGPCLRHPDIPTTWRCLLTSARRSPSCARPCRPTHGVHGPAHARQAGGRSCRSSRGTALRHVPVDVSVDSLAVTPTAVVHAGWTPVDAHAPRGQLSTSCRPRCAAAGLPAGVPASST